MKTQNLNKQEVIAALLAGHKVTHRFFQDGEFCYQENNDIVFEDGTRMPIKEFWGIREGGMAWDMAWSIVEVQIETPIIKQSTEMVVSEYDYKEKFHF